jgi:hypothetical protein
MARKVSRKAARRSAAIFWSLAGFFSLGYFPTMMAKTPVISMTVATCLIVPFAARSVRLRRAILRGLGLGFVAGVGIWSALSYGGRLPRGLSHLALIYVAATAGMCAAASALFYHVGKKRRGLMEEGWKR